ncbi:hypothetical protein MMC17_000942 [Xylographa soralifera]|nr:hypothetical protein [Xylographa soralifera]
MEGQGTPSKYPRASLGEQYSSDQAKPPQSLRALSDNFLGHDQVVQNLYSIEPRDRQTRAPIIELDDNEFDEFEGFDDEDGEDGEDSDGNPNQSDRIFTLDQVNNAVSHLGFQSEINQQDCMNDEDLDRHLANQHKAEQYRQSRALKSLLPSMTVPPARRAIPKHDHHGVQLGIKVNVELRNGDFMRITELQEDPYSKNIFLRGWLFRRIRFLDGTIEKKLNEVYLIQNFNQSDARSHEEQTLVEVNVNQVVRRRGLRMTNRPYPELSYREEDHIPQESIVINQRVLVCRWKYICSFRNERALQKKTHCEKALVTLRSEESDGKWATNDESLRRNFRGDTIKGGASTTFGPARLAQIREEQNLARKVATRSGELLPSTSIRNSSFRSPGSSFDTPLDVDLPLSRMSLEPDDSWSNSLGRVSKTTEKTHDANPRVSLLRQQTTRELSSSFNGTIINLTIDEKNYSRRQDIQLGSRESHEKNGNGSREHKGNTSGGNAPSRPRASASANTWDVRNGFFVQKTIRLNTSPKPGFPSDSDSAFTGDDNIDGADLLKWQEVPGPLSYVRHIVKHNELLVRGSFGSLDRPNAVYTPQMGRSIQGYTFGDGFCGCGGVSRGATIAGLDLRWSFDNEQSVCTSYSRNFRTPRVFCLDAFDFVTGHDFNANVDILHLSPPCQFFSPAHTQEGKNDDVNTAASFVIAELLKKVKPRIVTLENTQGLEQRHHLYLHAVVQQFTVLGFSLRWKIVDFRDYGVPQSRRRLIIIAACPGEILPDFPKPTHSKTPGTTGLKPWATINEFINAIPRDFPDHDISKASKKLRQPFDGNSLAKCVTTKGGDDNYHPSGRNYTIREFACLQTFPLEHKWDQQATMTSRRKQIGNAVPPIFYAALAKEIVRTLEKTDGVLEFLEQTG